ncbi:hypothetical protein PQR02_31850 [Paraburkholderia sediminicola]|uniref:Uncharacterized protein n=1 Tax=Paraburkholderia rhynchosiae TaxID=487049 RepID=A0ACC7NMC3_9BURK
MTHRLRILHISDLHERVALDGVPEERMEHDELYEIARGLPAYVALQLRQRSSSPLHRLAISAALAALARTTRPQLCTYIGALAPLMRTLGGEPTVVECTKALADIGRWWP